MTLRLTPDEVAGLDARATQHGKSRSDVIREALAATAVYVHASGLRQAWGPGAIQAATSATWIEDLDDESPARQLRLGFDNQGRSLDVIVLVFDSGNEFVIHAMKARPQMLDFLS